MPMKHWLQSLSRTAENPAGAEHLAPRSAPGDGLKASETGLEALRRLPLLDLRHEGTTDCYGKLAGGSGGDDTWRLGDALEGTQIFGSTGSGKTSGSGATLARSFLDPQRGNMGGLVLTAKPDDIENWRRYLADVQRPANDLVELGPDFPERVFNFLRYESEHGGAGGKLTQNLVSLFVAALSTGESAVSRVDPYWNDALGELLTHTIDLAVLAEEDLRLEDLAAIIRSAPQSRTDVLSAAWRDRSTCFRLLQKANELVANGPRRSDLKQTVAYWLGDFPGLNERTRSIIISSFTSKASGLLRSPLRELFCGELSLEVHPERSHEGKIIVVNLPVNTYGEVGRFAQILYKTVWQRSTERRRLEGDWRPVFLWADESQYFVTSEDALFQQTARSKFAATVYLTQNIPNYHAALGSSGEAATESLLGNLQTKIFHANGDPATNDWSQRVIGQDWTPVPTHGQSGDAASFSTSRQMAHQIVTPTFTMLRKGSNHDGGRIQSVVFQGGRSWTSNNNKNHIEHTFTR